MMIDDDESWLMMMMIDDHDHDDSMMIMTMKHYGFRSGNDIKDMMIMTMKHYGFRSGNDIKAGGFCTGTNDQEKQEAWDPILPFDEEGNDDLDNFQNGKE